MTLYHCGVLGEVLYLWYVTTLTYHYLLSHCIHNQHETKRYMKHTLLLSSEISRTASVTPNTPAEHT